MTLTRMQARVLTVMSTGHTSRQAADRLGIGQETVKTHLKTIRAKLNARNTAHAVAIGLTDRHIQ